MRNSAEDNARRAAAALAGAIEGFLEAIEHYDLGHEVEEGLHEAGKVVRAASEEGVAQADTPEMRMVGSKIRQAGIATADAASGAADSVRTKAHDARHAVQDKVEDIRDAAYNLKEEVKVRADAVAESGRRARVAPKKVGHEVKKAVGSWWHGFTTAMAMNGLIGVFAITAWIVLTIAMVVGLNRLVGDPGGTFLVVLIDVIFAGIAYGIAKSRRAAAQAETRRRMANSREEIRRVGRPVREAFAGRGRAGF